MSAFPRHKPRTYAWPTLLSVAFTGTPSTTSYCKDRVLVDRAGNRFYVAWQPPRFEGDQPEVIPVTDRRSWKPYGNVATDATGNGTANILCTFGGSQGDLEPGTVLMWTPSPPTGMAATATVQSVVLTGLDAVPDNTLTWPRRYYLLKRRLELSRNNRELAAAWRAKQEALYWPPLPAGFPFAAFLTDRGYSTVRDLDGALIEELLDLGLTGADAQLVLDAMESWHMIPTTLASYVRQDGRTATLYNAPLMPDTVFTAASGNGDTYEMGELFGLRLTLSLVAFVGGSSPTLNVQIFTSHDGVTNWQAAGTFAPASSAGSSETNVFTNCDRFVRVQWSVTGSPTSVEFSVLGEAGAGH